MPAGHGPGKSIEKFDTKFRQGDAANLNKRNGESQEFPLGEHVGTSYGHTTESRKLEI